MTDKKKAKSPYNRYKKTPYRYSDLYQKWKRAVLDNDKNAIETCDRAWRRRFIFGINPENYASK